MNDIAIFLRKASGTVYVTGGYYNSGLRATMIVSKLNASVLLKHDLLCTRLNDAITINDVWNSNIKIQPWCVPGLMQSLFPRTTPHHGWWCVLRLLPQVYLIIKITFNTLRPRQNSHHFPEDIFKCICLNENIWILIKISLFIWTNDG